MKLSIVQKTTEEADLDKDYFQNIILEREVSDKLISVTANLNRAAAFIIPISRYEEFALASSVDKVRFLSISQKVFQSKFVEVETFEEIFEIEYQKEFS